MALDLAAEPDLAPASWIALQTARLHRINDLPCALVTTWDPRNKNPQRRTDHRVITGGRIEVGVGLGHVG